MTSGTYAVTGGLLFVVFVRLIVPGLSFTEYLLSTSVGIAAVYLMAAGVAKYVTKLK